MLFLKHYKREQTRMITICCHPSKPPRGTIIGIYPNFPKEIQKSLGVGPLCPLADPAAIDFIN